MSPVDKKIEQFVHSGDTEMRALSGSPPIGDYCRWSRGNFASIGFVESFYSSS